MIFRAIMRLHGEFNSSQSLALFVVNYRKPVRDSLSLTHYNINNYCLGYMREISVLKYAYLKLPPLGFRI